MKFRQEYGQDSPEGYSTVMWYKLLMETGSMLKESGSQGVDVE
jgi:hypothetical protein